MSISDSNWFIERSEFWPGQAMCLEIEKRLFEGKSDFQDVKVFQSKSFGKVLVLDGALQLTERDEFAYQEMISHLPLLSHPNPKTVCVIGGGDGAVLTQIIKHKGVEKIVLCEIDKVVVEKSKEFFPQFLPGFNDPRVTVLIGDGFKHLEELPQGEYDVIIVDSSDPIGPAESLFGTKFYNLAKRALKPNGIICAQGECLWLHLDLIQELLNFNKTQFNSVEYAYTTIPTYPCGQIGFIICSNGDSCKTPKRTPEESFRPEDVDSLRYYHTDLHRAAFILPKFAQKIFE